MRAYRMWRVDFRGRLHPMFEWHWMFAEWDPGDDPPAIVSEQCNVSRTWFSGYAKSNRRPSSDNPYGLWSFRSRTKLVTEGWLYLDYLEPYWAWGEIELAGHVLEGSSGYRSERAAVRSISLVAPWWCRWYLWWRLRRHYDCPVTMGAP